MFGIRLNDIITKRKKTMKKPILIPVLITFSLISLVACGESPSNWTPDKVINKQDQRESRSYVIIGDKQVIDSDRDIAKAIYNSAPFEHTKSNGTTSENSFTYRMSVNGDIFPVSCDMVFYEDGFVEVKSKDANFCYKFDEKQSADLYQLAVTFVNEHSQA